MQRMNSSGWLASATLVCLLGVIACADNSAATQNADTVSHDRPRSAPDVAHSSRAKHAPLDYETEQDLFNSFAPIDRAEILAFYASYGESILDFHGAEQLAWLRNHQYPMPEDVLAASARSEKQLLADYRQGDLKAGFFYLDRASSRLVSGEVDEHEERQLDGRMREYLASGSPLAGYAYYNYQQKVHRNRHAAFAGLVFASDLGDGRASLEMMNQAYPQYAKDPASLDPIKLLMAYRLVLSNVRAQNPNVLIRRWPPFPPVKAKI